MLQSELEQDEVIILTTKKPLPRWLRLLLKILAALLAVVVVIAGVIGWRYYRVQLQLKKDLLEVIRREEYIRSLGGVNAVTDLIDHDAPESWRFRYLSSVRSHKGLPAPKISIQSVSYDGGDVQVRLLVNGVRQFRHYRLQADRSWRRAPYVVDNWGRERSIQVTGGPEIVYRTKDKAFAQELAQDLPDLIMIMSKVELTPVTKRFVIIPQELGDSVYATSAEEGLIVNSPGVDLIYDASQPLTPQQLLKLTLARRLMKDARDRTSTASFLPGAARVQQAIDDVLACQWAMGEISDETLTVWARMLAGHWVSPVTGLPPNLVTQLPPDAPDIAARLMMVWLLREKGPDALFTLNTALTNASAPSWDKLYLQVAGKRAIQVEKAAAHLVQMTDELPSDWMPADAITTSRTLTILSPSPDASGRLLAQTAAGEVILLQPGPGAPFTLADGSSLMYECIAPGTQVNVQGTWVDSNLWLKVDEIQLEEAVLPHMLQTPPQDPWTFALAWRYQMNKDERTSRLALVQLFPGTVINAIAHPAMNFSPYPPILLRRPPLLVWQQKISHCDRTWIVAYDPTQGIVGSWLSPAATPDLASVKFTTQGDDDVLLMTLTDGNVEKAYKSDERHVLQPVSPQTYNELFANSPDRWKSYIDHENQTLQVLDLVSGERSTLYRPAKDEEITNLLPAWTGDENVYYFTVRLGRGAANTVQVKQVSRLRPGQATPFLDVPQRGTITSLAICPDRSILYGLTIPSASGNRSLLRAHKLSGEDVEVSSVFDERLAPITCTRPPLSLSD